RKALLKDSTSAETQYIMSLYYFSSANPAFDMDSAFRYSQNSLRAYSRTLPKERDRLKRVPLDSARLVLLAQRIDSASFDRAKRVNTPASYQNFIDRHPHAQ